MENPHLEKQYSAATVFGYMQATLLAFAETGIRTYGSSCIGNASNAKPQAQRSGLSAGRHCYEERKGSLTGTNR